MAASVRAIAPKIRAVEVPAELREFQKICATYLAYDPDTGAVAWKKKPFRSDGKPNNRVRIGEIAGCIDPSTGYRKLGFMGRNWYAHRIAWLLQTGEFPETIDHVNGDVHDNRWVNLRAATQGENTRNQRIRPNNTSGHVGVSWCRRDGRWYAYIRVDKRSISLGRYDTIDDAILARRNGELKYHGSFSRHVSRGGEA